jgi:hypothetical protein
LNSLAELGQNPQNFLLISLSIGYFSKISNDSQRRSQSQKPARVNETNQTTCDNISQRVIARAAAAPSGVITIIDYLKQQLLDIVKYSISKVRYFSQNTQRAITPIIASSVVPASLQGDGFEFDCSSASD